ncbi:response regulator [Leucobacter luti]|uniref:LuxR family two component transcriptional regulator n=1 Tax=Leucobacter luti TaxID=340320 RepID=A0A4Q7U5Y6_9MICO|nr:response regulator transcription factor [Leucobacter luti]MBL3700634.1 DNA-binding response regulator [Leucobacter luti]RZT68527.1 LuxR family two component transcriptional regulator [Leucobacter luti]
MIHLLLVDDHPVLRHGIRSLLDGQSDLSVVAETGDAETAVEIVRRERVDVALVDLDLGPGVPDGAAATRMILGASPTTRVIAFTAFDSDADVVRMVEAGATGYLVKDSRPAELFNAIRRAAGGSPAIADPIAQRLLDRLQRPDAALTARELEVLELAAAGLSNRELARELLVSEATVKTHLHHAFTKLGAENRQAAIATAIHRGLIRMSGPGA